MSQPASNVNYDRLPLTNDDNVSGGLYNAPPSPGPASSFHTPQIDPRDFPDDSSIPVGAAQPRFLGAALYSDGGSGVRDSIASSHNTMPSDRGSEYTSSVYALNDSLGRTAPTGALYDSGYRDDPNDPYTGGERGMAMSPVGQPSRGYMGEKRAAYTSPRSKRKVIILAVVISTVLLILAIVIPVYFAVVRPNAQNNQNLSDNDSDSSNSDDSSGDSSDDKPKTPVVAAVVTGGDGSEVELEDGSKYTYRNSFGGHWYWDPNDPFNNGARPQLWSPALNETFNYGVDRIRGVNLGGWLNLEPFISPAMFEPYADSANPAVDEWTLAEILLASDGNLDKIEEHYKTFITEKDFAEIAGAGLNYVRIPISYWAVETRDNEPFLAHTQWTYFLKAIQWARKYGIRINLDLHAVVGSQNGWNHSGRLGAINFLNGPMGIANAQRTLDHIRVIAEFISQPQYKDVVTMFGILNEPQGSVVGQEVLSAFYLEAYNIVRTAGGGSGDDKGVWVGFHDGFFSRDSWAGVFPNADRVTLDSHPYICFNDQSDAAMRTYAEVPCRNWGKSFNDSNAAFGLTNAGEFSNAVTDCGLYLNGVNLGTRYEGTYSAGGSWPRVGDCSRWTDWTRYDQQTKDAIKQFALASMDALQNYFFWTWKIGDSIASGRVETPAWSYQLGLEQGWMPTDPREADGACRNIAPFTPPLPSGNGNIPANVQNNLAFPPPSISNAGAASRLPTYTATGPIPTLPGPTFTGSSVTATPSVGNGWANPNDDDGFFVEVSGCSYLDPWIGPTAAPPSPLC